MGARFGVARITVGTVVLGLAGGILSTPASSQGNDAEAVACQRYGITQRLQRGVAMPYLQGGTGLGCSGAVGPRWANDNAGHFQWCMGVTQTERDSETQARRAFLLECNKRRKPPPPGLDEKTCVTFSAGEPCVYSPSPQGKADCNAFGNRIISTVEKVRQDPSMLFDPVKDDGLNNSRFYHHFGYWTGFSCETRTGTGGTTRVVLIGQVGPGAIGRPKNTGQMKTPGPIPIDASKRKNIDLYRK